MDKVIFVHFFSVLFYNGVGDKANIRFRSLFSSDDKKNSED
ncbi:hypothetical protein AB996_0077 [Lactococcus cremoris]|uniref:Uncharacterized protein n=1 Tax=Lactococcus lactis subsp. cremoris TaxID=1359 RepID=A0A161W5A9_LACLC|nr:hypothetical protein AB996_0077 [Lactococcus cremoris]